MVLARRRAWRPVWWRTRSGGALSVWCRAWSLLSDGSRRQARNDPRRIMAELLEIEPGDRAVVDDHAAADDEMAQMRGAGRRDRPEQRVMQAEIARMRQLEDGKIGKLAGGENAGLLEAQNARAVDAAPPHYVLDAHGTRSFGGPMDVPGAVHLADHVGGFV